MEEMAQDSIWHEKSISDSLEKFQHVMVKEKDPTKETETGLPETAQKPGGSSVTEVKGILWFLEETASYITSPIYWKKLI